MPGLGSCKWPIKALATVEDRRATLRGIPIRNGVGSGAVLLLFPHLRATSSKGVVYAFW